MSLAFFIVMLIVIAIVIAVMAMIVFVEMFVRIMKMNVAFTDDLPNQIVESE